MVGVVGVVGWVNHVKNHLSASKTICGTAGGDAARAEAAKAERLQELNKGFGGS